MFQTSFPVLYGWLLESEIGTETDMAGKQLLLEETDNPLQE